MLDRLLIVANYSNLEKDFTLTVKKKLPKSARRLFTDPEPVILTPEPVVPPVPAPRKNIDFDDSYLLFSNIGDPERPVFPRFAPGDDDDLLFGDVTFDDDFLDVFPAQAPPVEEIKAHKTAEVIVKTKEKVKSKTGVPNVSKEDMRDMSKSEKNVVFSLLGQSRAQKRRKKKRLADKDKRITLERKEKPIVLEEVVPEPQNDSSSEKFGVARKHENAKMKKKNKAILKAARKALSLKTIEEKKAKRALKSSTARPIPTESAREFSSESDDDTSLPSPNDVEIFQMDDGNGSLVDVTYSDGSWYTTAPLTTETGSTLTMLQYIVDHFPGSQEELVEFLRSINNPVVMTESLKNTLLRGRKSAPVSSGPNLPDDISKVISDLDPEFFLQSVFRDNPFIELVAQPWLLFLYQLYRSRTYTDAFAAYLAFHNSVSGEVRYSLSVVFPVVWAAISTFVPTYVQTESLHDNVGEFKRFLHQVYDGEILTIFRNILLLIVSTKVFSKDVARTISTVFGKVSSMSIVEMFFECLNHVISLLRCCELVWNGAPLSSLLFSSDPCSSTLAEAREILYYADKLYPGLPVEGRMCEKEFVIRAKKCRDTLIALMKEISVADNRYRALLDMKDRLGSQLVLTTARLSGRQRPTPMAIVLWGDPGLGKSSIISWLASVWSEVKGRRFDDSHIFHRNADTEYWDFYDPLSHPIIQYKEPGSVHPNLVRVGGDSVMVEITSVVDGDAYPVNVAFEGKGKIFARPELVLMDCNKEDLNLDLLVRNPAAYRRRFLYIHPTVKPEYRIPHTMMLDSAASTRSDTYVMDRWNFEVYEMRAVNSVVSRKIVHKSGCDIFELYDFLKDHFANHIQHQDVVLKEISKGRDDVAEQIEEHSLNFVAQIINSESARDLVSTESDPGSLFPTYAESKRRFLNWWNGPYSYAYLFLCATISMVAWQALGRVSRIAFWFLPGLGVRLANWGISVKMAEAWNRFARMCAAPTIDLFELRLGFKRDHALKALAMFAGALSLYIVYSKITRKKKNTNIRDYVKPQAVVSLEDPVSTLEEIEEKLVLSDSYKRVAGKQHPVWNVMRSEHTSYPSTQDLESFSKFISKNQRFVRVHVDGVENKTFILGVRGNYAVINTHSLGTSAVCTVKVSTTSKINEKDAVFLSTVIDSSRRIDLGNDVSLLSLSGVRFRDIMKHIKTGDLVAKHYRGFCDNKSTTVDTSRPDATFQDPALGLFVVTKCLRYVNKDHRVGLCGSALCVEAAGNVVAGIHAGGIDEEGVVTSLDRTHLEWAISELDRVSPILPLASVVPVDTQALTRPHTKSPFLYENLRGLTYYGRLPDFHIDTNNRSKLYNSKDESFVSTLLEREFDYVPNTLYTRPLMQPRVREDGVYISPWNNALRKINKQRSALDPAAMGKTIDILVRRFVPMLKERLGDRKLSPLTAHSAINGAKDDPFIGRINASTSGGFGFKGKKSDYLPIWDVENTYRKPIDDLATSLAARLESYCRGESGGVVYSAQLKDEPRPVEKVRDGKTRVFYMSPLDNLVLCRMFLSPFYSLMVEHSDVFCTAIGYNMHSQAGRVVGTLSKFPGNNIMEGDYGTYDQSMSFDVGHAVNSIIWRVCKELGYSDDHLVVLTGLLTDLLFPVVCMNGDLFEAAGLQPSGKYATAEDNSLRGLFMLVYFWVAKGLEGDFFDYVSPVTYGDDVLAQIHPDRSEEYNNVTYRDFCKEVFGLEYTPASKSGDMSPFVTRETCSFLKRTFVVEPDGFCKAPLALDSLFRMLQWRMPSGSVSSLEQLKSILTSWCWEVFFHCSDVVQYDRIVTEVSSYYSAKYFDGVSLVLPSYEEINATVRNF